MDFRCQCPWKEKLDTPLSSHSLCFILIGYLLQVLHVSHTLLTIPLRSNIWLPQVFQNKKNSFNEPPTRCALTLTLDSSDWNIYCAQEYSPSILMVLKGCGYTIMALSQKKKLMSLCSRFTEQSKTVLTKGNFDNQLKSLVWCIELETGLPIVTESGSRLIAVLGK